MHTPHTPKNRYRIPVPRHTALLHDLFEPEQMRGVQEELTDWWAASKVLPKGRRRTPVDEAIERLGEAGLVNTADVFRTLGEISIGYPHVAWYDLDTHSNGHPFRHNQTEPALRHTVILEGQSVIKTGGIDVLGSHLFATGVTMNAGDDYVGNYTGPEQFPLVSILGVAPVNSRLTIDFIA